MRLRDVFALLVSVVLLSAHSASASGMDILRVGKAVPFSWTFTPLDIGVEEKIFEKNGLKIEISAFTGDARLQQALAANGVDIGIGSGPGMGFVAKGLPLMTIAAMANSPRNMALVLPASSNVTTIDHLKGAKIGVTTVGSLTDWLAKRLAFERKWGANGVTTVSVGGMDTMRAAMKTGQIQASVTSTESAYTLQDSKEWLFLRNFGDVAPRFHTHVFFARNAVIDSQNDQVRRFLKGWFETIAFMRSNKARSVEISAKVLKLSPEIIGRTYDEVMPMFSDDGHFDSEALTVLKESFVELGILTEQPTNEKILTTKFVNVR